MAVTRTRISVDPSRIGRFRRALSEVATDPDVVNRATVSELCTSAMDIATRELESLNTDRAQVAALGGGDGR